MRRPTWWAVVLLLLGVAIFVRLGVWQLHRAQYKQQLLDRFAASASAPLVPFDRVARGVSGNRYPHVSVHGHFIPHRRYVLDDKTHANRQGVEVYAPFQVAGADRVLLVDLGFLPRTRDDNLPHLPPLKTASIVIDGLYAKAPPAGLKLGGNQLPGQTSWPKVGIYIDLADIGADLGRRMFPRVLLIDADPSVAYIRQWVPDTMPPARHQAYAFQWFSFAGAAIVIFVILNRRRPGKTR
jgi:cytochrome oxidase assembly protein ShyY1